MGERISFCRGMLGLTREKFAEKFKVITLSTLARWELDKINIPEPKLNYLIDFLKQNGVLVKSEWLRYGEGTPPINLAIKDFDVLNFDETTYTTLSSVAQKVVNFKFYQVNNNLYEPIIRFGDYIGGSEICENYKILHNKFCYFKTNSSILIGVYNFNNNLLIGKNDGTQLPSIVAGGEVTWISRRP